MLIMSMNATKNMLTGKTEFRARYPDAHPDDCLKIRVWLFWCWYVYKNHVDVLNDGVFCSKQDWYWQNDVYIIFN